MLLFNRQPIENNFAPLDNTNISDKFRNKFLNEILKLHNQARAYYGDVPALNLDQRLNRQAQKYADYLASVGSTTQLNHSKVPMLGENLCRYFNSLGRQITPEKVMNEFLTQAKLYDFKFGDYSKPTAHFTQLVWKQTRKLGIGLAKAKNGSWYVVCNYEPAGNISGLFRENVLAYEN